MRPKAGLKYHQAIELWWTDSTTTHGWSKRFDIRHGKDSADVHSVGFIVHATKDDITFTASFDPGTDFPYQCMHTVPWCSIRSLRMLKLNRVGRRRNHEAQGEAMVRVDKVLAPE